MVEFQLEQRVTGNDSGREVNPKILITAIAKIGVNYLQLTSLARKINMEWPSQIAEVAFENVAPCYDTLAFNFPVLILLIFMLCFVPGGTGVCLARTVLGPNTAGKAINLYIRKTY